VSSIHPTAWVDPEAHLAEGVRVGPYAYIEAPVELGEGVVIGPHAVILRYVRLGPGVQVGAHAVLGGEPQDLSFQDQETWLEVGPGTVIREGVTLHRATRAERPTRIGARCYLMAYAHVAHDCQLGDGVILTNNVMLAGHVEVGSGAVLGGGAAVHQFVRIGAGAMLGGMSGANQDILPYSLAHGVPARHYRLNTVGLRRKGIQGERYQALEQAFRALRAGRIPEGETEEVLLLRAFINAPSRRGIARFLLPSREDAWDE
jgi:UDP-N-acetylglucosamine acyltransferase